MHAANGLVTTENTAQEIDTGGGTLATNTWTHVTGVANDGTNQLRIYFDGLEIGGTANTIGTMAVNNVRPLFIGADRGGASGSDRHAGLRLLRRQVARRGAARARRAHAGLDPLARTPPSATTQRSSYGVVEDGP